MGVLLSGAGYPVPLCQLNVNFRRGSAVVSPSGSYLRHLRQHESPLHLHPLRLSPGGIRLPNAPGSPASGITDAGRDRRLVFAAHQLLPKRLPRQDPLRVRRGCQGLGERSGE